MWEKEKETVTSISTLKKEIEQLKFKMESCFRDGNYSEASKIQYESIPSILNDIEKYSFELQDTKFVKLEVNSEDVAEVVSNWTGIPVQKMMEGEQEKLLKMESILNRRVMGQDKATSIVSDVIRNSKLGFSDFQKPIGSFLFLGKTGVGKTELAKTIADALFLSLIHI